MTITSETAQSGMVSHEVERDGADVRVKVSFAGGYAGGAYSITPEHARELAEALLEVSGYPDIAQSIKAYAEWRKAAGKVIADVMLQNAPIKFDAEARGGDWATKIEIQPHEIGMLVQVNERLV